MHIDWRPETLSKQLKVYNTSFCLSTAVELYLEVAYLLLSLNNRNSFIPQI